MISLETLQTQLPKCQTHNKISLPGQKKSFVQNTAYDFKVKTLQNNLKVCEFISQVPNYTMEKELEKLRENIEISEDKEEKEINYIPNRSLILITENSSLELPEILVELLKEAKMNNDQYYVYGTKNPDSFCKSLLLLFKNDFIIGNKNRRRNNVLTFKKELIIKCEQYCREGKYMAYNIVKTKLLNNILNVDNYAQYDICIYLADYLQTNLLIIDIIDNKYLPIEYRESELNKDYVSNENHSLNYNSNQYLTLIKYDNDTYLPLMNYTGTHAVDSKMIQVLKDKGFARFNIDKFKYRDLDDNREEIKEDRTVEKEVKKSNEKIINISATELNKISVEEPEEKEEEPEEKEEEPEKKGDEPEKKGDEPEEKEEESEITKNKKKVQSIHVNEESFNIISKKVDAVQKGILDKDKETFINTCKKCSISEIKAWSEGFKIQIDKLGKTKAYVSKTKLELLTEIKDKYDMMMQNKKKAKK